MPRRKTARRLTQREIKAKETRKRIKYIVLAALIAASLFFFLNDRYWHINGIPTTISILRWCGLAPKPDYVLKEGESSVTFIDVGQGDCTLIRTNNKTVLIDSGEEENYSRIMAFLKYAEIPQIDIVIITHPHSDHCGSMAKIISTFKTEMVLMPEISDESGLNIPLISKLMKSIEDSDAKLCYAKAGDVFQLDNAVLTVVGPVSNEYDDLNENSIAVRFDHKETSYLFMADIGYEAEFDIIDSGADIDVDILKVGHHGSAGSTSLEFLRYVTPDTAVFHVGKDNSYGHPKRVVFDRLNDAGCERAYSTMGNGNIVFVSDGETVEVFTQKNNAYIFDY